MTDFSGDEQKEQLEILYNTFENAIKDFADQLSEGVNYTFGTLGADIDMDKFADSIRQVMYDKRTLTPSLSKTTAIMQI